MKSIISRYGEMKEGMSADTEGEGIAYNKVDKALQSIGMTLKDTNGQFRDFDDVIEELASKWDTLDSLQQRYIATIFAGNRQQSRFLALVSNYDRYMEVSAAAADAEDAGLLQYSKTLDSLETKLNNLSTSFQQFYMSIANGAIFGGAIEGITKFVEGLNKLGNFSAIMNVVGILRSLKLVTKTAVNAFTTMTSQIRNNVETVFTQIASSMVAKMRQAGSDSVLAIQQGAQQGAQGPNPNSPGKAVISPKIGEAINVASLVGAGLSIAGTGVAVDNAFAGSLMTTAGSALSFGSQGAMIGSAIAPGIGTAIGAAIGVLAGALSQIPALINAHANQAQEALDKATKEAEEKNIERAQAAEDYRSLESTIENLKKLQAARYDSEEAEKAFADAQKEAAEKFPELISGYTTTGEAIVDAVNNSTNAELILADARKKAADATLEAAAADLNKANKEAVVKSQAYEPYKEARRQFLANFNRPTDDTVTLPDYEDIPGYLKDDLYYNENVRLLYEQIRDFEKYKQRLNNYREQYGYQGDNTELDKELQYMALIDQFNEEYDTAYADLLTVNATQSQKQRIELSAALSQSLASDLNPDLWTKSGAISSLVSNAFTSQFFDENGKFNRTYDEYFDSEGKIKATQITGAITDFFNNNEAFFNSLQTEEQISGFEKLIEGVNKGQYTTAQLETELQNYGIDSDTNQEIYEALLTPIQETIERVKNKINSSNFDIKYMNGLDLALETLPTIILNSLSSFMTDLENKIENGQITQDQADKFLKQYTAFAITAFQTPGLNYSQKMTAANIIAQGDMTTLFGQYQIQQQLDEALGEGKIDLIRKNDKGKWESNVETAVENVVLSYQAFSENLATSVSSMSDAFKYASSGFELEDAQKIADKVGEDVKSLFTFDEGKWFINPESFDEIYKAYADANEEQKELLGQQKESALENIQAYLNAIEDGEDPTVEAEQAYKTYLAGAKNYYEKKNPGGNWESANQYAIFQEYLDFIGESAIAAADEQLEWLQKDLNKRTAVANYTSKVKDTAYGSKGYDWYEAVNILSQKGSFTGFTPEEAGKLIAEGIFKVEDFSEDGTGNLRVTEAAYRNALSEGGQYLVDQYDISLAEKARQLSDSVLTLGKSAAAGTAYDSDWLKLAQDLGLKNADELTAQWLKNFLSSEKYNSLLGAYLAERFEISEEDLKALRQEYQTGTALGTQELTEKTLDYYAKVLDGELTDIDIAALDGELGAAVQAFADNTSSQIATYIDTLLADTSMSFSDKVSNLASRYKNRLEKENPAFSSPELIAKNTRMSSSQASEMLAELNLLLNGEKKYTIDDLFSYNVADQTYSLIGKNYQAALKELENAIDNEPADSDRQKQLKNYLNQMRSAASEALFTNAESASETIEKFATSTETTFKDIQSVYSEVGGYISAAKASKLAAELNKLDPWDRINKLIEIYSGFGITLDSSKYNEIVNTVFDSILSEISNAVSQLSSGLSGKLSFSDFQKLIDQGYVTAQQGRVSYKGVQLTEEGRQSYLTKLYQQAKNMGNTFGLGEEIWSTLSDSQNQVFDGYKEIEDEISRIEGELKSLGDKPDKQGLQDYLSLLKEVRAAAMFDPNSAEFNFMNLDSTEGMTKNFDQFVSSIESAKSAFDTLRSGGDIGYNEFYNMMGFIEKYVSNSALQTKLDEFGLKINDFATAVVESSDEIGKVDLDGIAAKLGISASAAADLISSDMSQGLKDIAQQQVDYLTGIENMLKAMAEIDGTDATLTLNFTYTENGEKANFDLVKQTWQDFSALSPDQKKEIEVQFKTKFGVDLTQATFTIAKQTYSSEFQAFLKTIPTDEMAEQVGATIFEAMSNPESLGIFDKNGILVDNYEEIIGDFFTDVINGVNLSNYSSVVQEKLKALLESGTDIEINGTGATLSYSLSGSNVVVDIKDQDINAVKNALNAKLGEANLTIDEEISNKNGIYTFSVKPVVESAEGALISDSSITTANTELDDLTSKLTALDILTVTPTVSIVVDGLAALNRAVALMAQLGAKTSSTSSQTIPKVIKPRATATLMFSGSMNGIGPAFADGSIGRLRAGASFAQKTLVGELGPELAVYDGQYHLLGKDGAEFVKLPDDAIVFNHLQTQGIMSGQMNIRGMTMASGSISGPALANGNIAQALAAVQRAKAVWQGLLNKLSASDILGSGGGGGGGGGGDDKTAAVIQDLQEWYNLSRQIANIEQEINNIVAERENIVDGGAYLRSLRQQQELLEDQKSIQRILLDYQNKQLQRQADLINNDRIWSKFLTVGEGGLLQYTVGNETNGGKGALQVLDELNKMSGEEQIKYMSSIGYSYTDTDGNKLEGTELVTKFFEELQKQIDEYDALYDTVHETKQTIEELKSSIEKINEEIIQNQKDLEKSIYDIIVNAWQKQIDMLDEQAKLVKEANDNYVQGLNDALQLEQERYQQNQEIADRESLQRQLSLLRRSGGSASEIADLEKQLDEKLKDEYFDNQQKAINQIQEANEKQVKQLEQQIQIQKEALDYQKENGIIWTKVYDVMAGQKEEILQFMQGNSTDFFSKSTLEQEAMLTEWAKKIGIYTEDKQYQDYSNEAQQKYWTTGAVWGQQGLSSFKSLFDSLSDEEKAEIQNAYISTYADAMLRGADEAAASEQAAKEMLASLSNKQKVTTPTSTPTPAPIQTSTSTPAPAPEPAPAPQKRYRVRYTVYFVDGESTSGFGIGNSAYTARAAAEKYAAQKTKSSKSAPRRNTVYEKAVAFSEGGLVDYTGPAIVHGTPSKPEAFLNAEQTKQIREGLELTSDRGILSSLRAGISDLIHMANSIVNNSSLNNEINISKGAIQITVGNLNDKYDIEDVSNDIMNRIVSIASKATNRGVNRR